MSAEEAPPATDPSKSSCIYLDYNGTTPIYPEVLEAMMPYLTTHFGNPSSSHAYGQQPKQGIDQARRSLLNLLGVPDEPLSSIWFTSCGTESDNWAIHLALEDFKQRNSNNKENTIPRIVTCNVEHPAVDAYLQRLEDQQQIRLVRVPVQTDGRVQVEQVLQALQQDDNTILCTIMLANNESGAIQPLAPIFQYCRQAGVLCHTDAAQAAGKVSVHLPQLGHPDMVSLVGHKLGAPKGVAALYVRHDALHHSNHPHSSILVGGAQEFGHRGGTENVASIVGMGKAAELALEHLQANRQHMETMRSRLWRTLQQGLSPEKVRDNGPVDANHRLPNTLSVGFRNVHSGDLLKSIGHLVAASAGATCHGAAAVSQVLTAMKVPMEFARGTLRLSLGPKTTEEEIDQAASIIIQHVQQQRSNAETSEE